MRKTAILSAAFLSAILLAPSFASAGSPMADKLPEDSVAYIGWAGRTPAFDGTMLGQMLDDPSSAGIIDVINQLMRLGQRGSDEDLARQFSQVVELGSLALKHPVAISVYGLKAVEGSKAELGLAVVVDMGKDKDAFEKAIQQLLDSLAKNAKFDKATVGSLPCRKMKLGDKDEMTIVSSGDMLYLSVGQPQMTEQILQIKAEKSLASAPAFVDAMKTIGADNPQASIYINIDSIYKFARQMTGSPEPAKAGQDAPASRPAGGRPGFQEIVDAIGVGKITAIAGATQIADKNFLTRVRLFSPAPHQGLLMPFAGQPITEADLACVPDDADFLLAFKLAPDAAFAEFRRVLKLLEPRAENAVAHGLVDLETELGFTIEKDLLANLGDTWTLCEAQSQGGLLTGTVLTVQAKNAQKLQEVQTKIETYVKEKLFAQPKAQPGDEPEIQLNMATILKPSIKSIKYNQAEIHYLSMRNLPVAPAWTIYKDRVIVGLFPQVLMTTIDNLGLKPLAKDPEFVKLRSKLSDKACMLTYGDSTRITRELYPILLLLGTYLSNSTQQGEKSADFIFPTALSKLQKYASRDVGCIWADDKGIVYENMSNGGMFSTPAMALVGGAVLPMALSQARSNAKKAASMSNLSSIAKATMLFGGEFDDKPPTSMGLLVAYKNMISPKALVSPVSGRKPPKVDEKGNISGEVDYIYFVLDDQSSGDTIRAYERPENYNNKGTIILKANCTVQWVDMDTFKFMMEQSAEDQKRGKDKGYNPFAEEKK